MSSDRVFKQTGIIRTGLLTDGRKIGEFKHFVVNHEVTKVEGSLLLGDSACCEG